MTRIEFRAVCKQDSHIGIRNHLLLKESLAMIGLVSSKAVETTAAHKTNICMEVIDKTRRKISQSRVCSIADMSSAKEQCDIFIIVQPTCDFNPVCNNT